MNTNILERLIGEKLYKKSPKTIKELEQVIKLGHNWLEKNKDEIIDLY